MSIATKTYIPKESEITRNFFLIDAKDKVLGKVATKAATYLRGKHKSIFTPHLDTGDIVIVINAEKVKVTGKKRTDKIYQRYSGYPSGQKTLTFEEMQAKAPTEIITLAVNRMIPSGPLGSKVKKHLRVYTGEEHPHQAQNPIPLEI